MNELFTHLLIVLVPLILTSTFHMVVVKKKCLNVLEIPIWPKDLAKTKPGELMFFVPLTNGLCLWLISFVCGLHIGLSIFARLYPGIKLFTLRITQLVFETQGGNQTREAIIINISICFIFLIKQIPPSA